MKHEKSEIRDINKAARAKVNSKAVAQKSRVAAESFLKSRIYKNSNCIMLYMPLGNEVDTAEIIKAACRDGKRLVFPVTDKDTGEITPYYAAEDTLFKRGAFSVSEPCGTEAAELKQIDAVIVPGIAFDRFGNRVGFGKGCYDRLLQRISAVKIGLCYDFQVCDEIAADLYDVKMNFLITESGMVKAER
ncbi:MAG: 5-formyltetrahydrofolate cyclo-ligase [Clostridia bacterium]|nr:5-formyltetrahydrofolate cyclo-ligase [Clostridia bacterium]